MVLISVSKVLSQHSVQTQLKYMGGRPDHDVIFIFIIYLLLNLCEHVLT